MDNNIKERNAQDELEERFAEFEQQNPQIAEAMRIFEMTIGDYDKALYALRGSEITQVYHTSKDGHIIYGNQK